MPISFTIKDKGSHIEVTSKGKFEGFEDVKKYSKAVSRASCQINNKNILCDERMINYELSVIETVKLADYISENYDRFTKVALVHKIEKLNEASFFETVSRNRGIHIKVTTNKKDAEKWLIM